MFQSFLHVVSQTVFSVQTILSNFLASNRNRVAIALSALIILTSTACNPASAKVVGTGSSPEGITGQMGQQTELYDAVQPNVGGMNQHNDDFRYDGSGANKAKAEKLIRRAEQEVQRVQSPKDYVENMQDNAKIGERTRQFSRELKERTDHLKTDLSKGAERGKDNLKANTEHAVDNIKKSLSDPE
jgi:hypothetical protein